MLRLHSIPIVIDITVIAESVVFDLSIKNIVLVVDGDVCPVVSALSAGRQTDLTVYNVCVKSEPSHHYGKCRSIVLAGADIVYKL